MACPGGSPSQTITVVNQANVRPATLTRVERAVSAQSLQVHAAWGTPCARFAPGGWKLYLKIGGPEPRGEHDYYGQPYALVWTGGGRVESWSRDVSHEVIEMLEDPTLDVRYLHDGSTLTTNKLSQTPARATTSAAQPGAASCHGQDWTSRHSNTT